MSDFFADAGAWFDQAGKDIDQGGQDFGEALQDGAQVIGEALPGVAQVVGDVAQVVSETVQDGAQVVGDVAEVIGDVFNPDNPNPNSVIDQIETNVDQQPTSGYVVDQIESTIVQPPTSGYVVDQIESTNNQQSIPDYAVLPDFDNPVPEPPSPVFETFDPLTNPNPGLESSAIEFSEVDALRIDRINDDDFNRRSLELFEDWLGRVGYDYIDSMMYESLMDSMNPIFDVAEVPFL